MVLKTNLHLNSDFNLKYNYFKKQINFFYPTFPINLLNLQIFINTYIVICFILIILFQSHFILNNMITIQTFNRKCLRASNVLFLRKFGC